MSPPRPCPVCQGPLETRALAQESVDLCPLHHGIFFDAGELEAALEQSPPKDPSLPVDTSTLGLYRPGLASKRACPLGHGAMQTFRAGPREQIELERCPRCGGIWTDDREFQALRALVQQGSRVDQLAQAVAQELRPRYATERWTFWLRSRSWLSLVLVGGYFLFAGSQGGSRACFQVLRLSLVPLAMIWFPEVYGLSGRGAWGGTGALSPPVAILAGWFFLTAPIWVGILSVFFSFLM